LLFAKERTLPRTREYPRIIPVDAGGIQGFLVIDSTVNNMSAGGVRLKRGLNAGELARLARVMTLKYGFLGLPCGGAKAGLDAGGDLGPEKRAAVFAAFGRALAPFIRGWGFRPGQDLGTTPEDIGRMLQAAGIGHAAAADLSPGAAFTGLSVAVTAVAAARFLGLAPERLSFVIAGFGRVGSAVARELVGRKCSLVGVSTLKGALYDPDGLDLARLLELRQRLGDGLVDAYPGPGRMSAAALLEVATDLLCPCANSDVVNEANAGAVRARIVCPGANLPLTDAAEKILNEREILCLPDFVANCGGVLGPTMLSAGLAEGYVRAFMETRLEQKVIALLAESRHSGAPLAPIARRSAGENFSRVRAKARRWRWLMGVARLGDYFRRRRWISRRLSAACTRGYFEKWILTPEPAAAHEGSERA
jgi:glutamate dehydrogenase (NAD(P)+)